MERERSLELLKAVEADLREKQDQVFRLTLSWAFASPPDAVLEHYTALKDEISQLEEQVLVLQENCFWLAEWLGWWAHDYLKEKWGRINWQTNCGEASWHTIEYALPCPDLTWVMLDPTVEPSTETCKLERFHFSEHQAVWLGYAPEIDTIFRWNGQN